LSISNPHFSKEKLAFFHKKCFFCLFYEVNHAKKAFFLKNFRFFLFTIQKLSAMMNA